jgi:hypothetical protein
MNGCGSVLLIVGVFAASKPFGCADSARLRRIPRTHPAYRLYSAVTAQAGTGHPDSRPACLLPGRTGSLRSVSGILTSPPQQDKRARSGSLRLHSAQTKGEEQFGTDRGKPGTPPAPKKHGPVPGFPPDPLSCLPESNGGSRRSHDRGRCKQNQCA